MEYGELKIKTKDLFCQIITTSLAFYCIFKCKMYKQVISVIIENTFFLKSYSINHIRNYNCTQT